MTASSADLHTDDRAEVIERPESLRPVMLVPGVEFLPMAGVHNTARGLSTAILMLAPGASMPYHARLSASALVLLEGEVDADVEDRRHRLAPLDTVAVLPSRSLRLTNPSAASRAVLHLAVTSEVSELTWVNGRFAPIEQPPDSPGLEGSERVVRRADAPVTELAPHARFQDLYNAALGTLGLCGGYGVFAPGARLPCHRHEFDESITIVQGTATCLVEGRRHELSGLATALVPRGRCHYFINRTDRPMAMIWVYAADMPDRIVMDESACDPEKAQAVAR